MTDILIRRTHQLGLEGAQAMAAQWSEKAQTKLQMACAYAKGDAGDELQFSRQGVNGTLKIGSDHFELNAQLGFLLSAFKDQIENEITKNLDAMLADAETSPNAKKPT